MCVSVGPAVVTAPELTACSYPVMPSTQMPTRKHSTPPYSPTSHTHPDPQPDLRASSFGQGCGRDPQRLH